jgi:hypothetical protein
MVLGAGIEPAHSEEYRILSPVRLPIPPPKQRKKRLARVSFKFKGKLKIIPFAYANKAKMVSAKSDKL